MSLQLMIDIESMSTEPDAAILSIGACTFYLHGDGPEDTFYTSITLESNEKEKRHFSASTMTWWLSQKPEALAALFDGAIPLRLALTQFTRWASNTPTKVTEVWANDPDFDVVIIRQACAATGINWPFPFWVNRSVRTVGAWAFPDPEELEQVKAGCIGEGVMHNAKDDAIAQAKLVQQAYKQLRQPA